MSDTGRDFIREAIDVLMDGTTRTLGDYIGHLNDRDGGGDSYAVVSLAQTYRDAPLGEALAAALAVGVVAEQLFRAARNTSPASDLGWHVISGEGLLDLLRRVTQGEDPNLVYAEAYANAAHERVDGADAH
jgi:hypothetical protein